MTLIPRAQILVLEDLDLVQSFQTEWATCTYRRSHFLELPVHPPSPSWYWRYSPRHWTLWADKTGSLGPWNKWINIHKANSHTKHNLVRKNNMHCISKHFFSKDQKLKIDQGFQKFLKWRGALIIWRGFFKELFQIVYFTIYFNICRGFYSYFWNGAKLFPVSPHWKLCFKLTLKYWTS